MKISTHKKKHCFGVAEHMYQEAEKLIQNNRLSENIDPNVAYTIGLLHDIGYLFGRKDHEENGSDLLQDMGLDRKYADIIRVHGRNPYLAYYPSMGFYARLLWDADMSVNADGQDVGYDGRLDDIMERYGEDSVAYRTANATVDFLLHDGNPELIGLRSYCRNALPAIDRLAFNHCYEDYFATTDAPYNISRFASYCNGRADIPESIRTTISKYKNFIETSRREEVER